MNALMRKLLDIVVKSLVGGDLFDHIKQAVAIQMNATNLTGEQKKVAVQANIKALKGDLGIAANNLGQTLLNLAIEAALVLVKVKLGIVL